MKRKRSQPRVVVELEGRFLLTGVVPSASGGVPAAEVSRAALTPATSQTLPNALTAAYLEILQRTPGANELVYWEQQMQAGLTPQAFMLDLFYSPEHEAQEINALFQTDLNRPADPTAISVFQTWMNYGASPTDISRALLDSAEFQAKHPGNAAFIAAVYPDILQRAADPAGMAIFQSWLNLGATHDNVVQALLTSPECRTLEVNTAYNNVLARPTDPTGLQIFTSMLGSGQGTLNTVYVDMLLSNENLIKTGFLTAPNPPQSQTLNAAVLSSQQFAGVFQPLGSAPEMASTFQFSSGLSGNVESQVFQGTGAAAGLYAYVYQVDVQSGSGGIQGVSWNFTNAPTATDLTGTDQSTYGYVIVDGSVGAVSAPQAAVGQSIVSPASLTWQPGTGAGTLTVGFGGGLSAGSNSATLVLLTTQAPSQAFMNLTSSNANDTSMVLTSVYAPVPQAGALRH